MWSGTIRCLTMFVKVHPAKFLYFIYYPFSLTVNYIKMCVINIVLNKTFLFSLYNVKNCTCHQGHGCLNFFSKMVMKML